MDTNKLRALAGLPQVIIEKQWSGDVDTSKRPPEGLFATGSSARVAGRTATLTSQEAQRLKNMCKNAKISCPEITIKEDAQVELSDIIRKLATMAEGKTGDALAAFISEVYAAGKRDNLTEEMSNEMSNFSFSVENENDAGWMATALAREGFSVDITFGDTFYFNFKTKAAKDEALEFVKKKEVEAVDTSEK